MKEKPKTECKEHQKEGEGYGKPEKGIAFVHIHIIKYLKKIACDSIFGIFGVYLSLTISM